MRIVHFSDFHLGKAQAKRAEAIVRRLIDTLKGVNQKKPIDLILFSGDLIDKAGKSFGESGMQTAFQAFQDIVIVPITTALSLPLNRFIFTLGNHDIDGATVESEEGKMLTTQLNTLEELDNYMHPDSAIPRIAEYNTFRDAYWSNNLGDVAKKSNIFNICLKLDIGGKKVGINCLNTVWRCSGKHGESKILLGKSQITDNRDFLEDCHLRLALGHHHPNMLQEFEETTIKQLLAKNYDAVFCGHTHDADGEYIERPQGSCFNFTAPGTLCSNISAEKKYQNGFMVVDFEQENGYVEARCYYQDSNEDFVEDMNYGENGVWHKTILGSTIIKPMSLSLFEQVRNGDFLSNDAINDCIEKLRNPEIDFMQLVALSGLGKTRILREAFDDGEVHPNYYYCEFSDNQTGLLYDVTDILQNHKGQQGLIVLDNCPNAILMEVIKLKTSYGSQFRIIGVNNDFYDPMNLNDPKITQIFLNQDQMRNMVNVFVDTNIPANNGDTSIREMIKKVADGFPGMAIELVQQYKDGHEDINIHSVDHIVKKLLRFEKGHEEKQEKVLRSLALFQPCPYENEYKEAFKFIRNNESITPLFECTPEEKRYLFSHTIEKYKKTLIEISEGWLNVRPFPLANWLVSKWFADDNDKERFEKIIADIENLDKPLRDVIKDGLCKRLEYMQDSVPAKEMMSLLTTGENAPFCNEKVVCSDLGSRLFLAMSSVNPVAIAKCLYDILSNKPIAWVKEYVKGDVRRNLVWALGKVCFNKDSYDYGCKVMALFAIAENETWSNNASGELGQLFHVLLPGTEANLKERLATLQYFKSRGDDHKELLLNCIDRAFDYGYFTRSGDAGQFGLHKKKDYVPSKKEIVDYWEGCTQILLDFLNTDGATLNRIAQMAVSHVFQWSMDGMIERQFPLLTKLAELKGLVWPEMYDAMQRIPRARLTFYSETFLSQLDTFKDQIRPKYFLQKLKNVQYKVYNESNTSIEDHIQQEQRLFRQLAQEFIKEELYKSDKEVRLIVEEKDFFDIYFSSELAEIIQDEQICAILKIFLGLISDNGGNMFVSNFAFRFCSVLRTNKRVRDFIQEIYNKGYHDLFLRMLAHCETEKFESYQTMREFYLRGDLESNAPADYLKYVSIPHVSLLGRMIKMFYGDFPQLTTSLMDFFIIYRFNKEIFKDPEVLVIAKEVILKYPITEVEDNPVYEYMRYVAELLEKYRDNDFAADFNRKMMELLKLQFLHRDFGRIYHVLITQYTDAIWPDFEKAFSNKEYYLFLFQIQHEIGSGSGFGVGPLFTIDAERIKKLCLKNPEYTPHMIAEMCPIFQHDDNNATTRFHDWVLWLLDEYGHMENVLSGLDSNLDSYFLTGSVIPLLTQKRECFEQIQNHKNPKVRKWADACLQGIDAEISREKNREEYMRLHYN